MRAPRIAERLQLGAAGVEKAGLKEADFNGYEGVAPNRAVAVHWFSEAAAQGNRAAVRNLQALGEEIPGQGGS